MNAKQMKEFMKALDAIVEEKKIDKKIKFHWQFTYGTSYGSSL